MHALKHNLFLRLGFRWGRLWHLAFCVVIGVLSLTHDLSAQKNTPRIPEAISSQVDVLRGGFVQITLQGVTERIGEMEFQIRDLPAHGTLSQVQKTGPRSAVVTYRLSPQLDPKVKMDHFTYSVKISGVSASAPATIAIQIVEPRSELWLKVTPSDTLNVAIGEEKGLKLVINNQGTGPAKVVIPQREGWHFEPASFEIGAQKEQEVLVFFRPTQAMDDVWGLNLDPAHDGGSVKIRGISYPPLVMSPPEVQLERQPPEGKQRVAKIKVANAGDRERYVVLTSEDGLKLEPSSLQLSANEVQEVRVELPSTLPGEGQGEIVAKERDVHREFGRVRWKAAALPLSVTLKPEGGASIDLGETSTVGSSTLKITHDQEVPVRVRVRTTGPFEVTGVSENEGVLVPAAEGQELEIRTRELPEGDSKGTLHVEWNGGRADYELRVSKKSMTPVAGKLPPSSASNASPSVPARPSRGSAPMTPQDTSEIPVEDDSGVIHSEVTPEVNERLSLMHRAEEGLLDAKSLVFLDLQTPQPVIDSFTTKALVVSWEVPEREAHQYEVQVGRRYLDKKLKIPVTEWMAWPGEVQFHDRKNPGDRFRVTLKGYYPGRNLEFRLQAFDAEDRRWKPSPTLRVTTPVRSWKWLYYSLGGVGVLIAGIVGWQKRRQRRLQHG